MGTGDPKRIHHLLAADIGPSSVNIIN